MEIDARRLVEIFNGFLLMATQKNSKALLVGKASLAFLVQNFILQCLYLPQPDFDLGAEIAQSDEPSAPQSFWSD
jgi:hypothetical protein